MYEFMEGVSLVFEIQKSLSKNSCIGRRRVRAEKYSKIQTSFMNSPFSENSVSIKELFALHALITLVTFSYKVASFDLFRFTTLRGRVEETVTEFQ